MEFELGIGSPNPATVIAALAYLSDTVDDHCGPDVRLRVGVVGGWFKDPDVEERPSQINTPIHSPQVGAPTNWRTDELRRRE